MVLCYHGKNFLAVMSDVHQARGVAGVLTHHSAEQNTVG